MSYLASCPDCGTKRTEDGLFELQVFHNESGKIDRYHYTCWVCEPEEGRVI